MEKAYICSEQVSQMQASYDAFFMLKLAHDAGCDLISNPINFYCYEWGSQMEVFWECIKRIFGDYHLSSEVENDYGEQERTFRIPFPELNMFFSLLGKGEKDKYISTFNAKLNTDCDYFDARMEGRLAKSCFYITLAGSWAVFSSFLKEILEIRKIVKHEIRIRKERLLSGLRNIVMMKKVRESVGSVVDVSIGEHTNTVFSRLMHQCNFDIALGTTDELSFEAMMQLLQSQLDQVVIQIRKGEAA